ncbi:hypothetical protein LTR08_003665 [Meristemomyces frigidus]|nr:hypothetical protein LTR08_003665 [Meristemomyces frigidus]
MKGSSINMANPYANTSLEEWEPGQPDLVNNNSPHLRAMTRALAQSEAALQHNEHERRELEREGKRVEEEEARLCGIADRAGDKLRAHRLLLEPLQNFFRLQLAQLARRHPVTYKAFIVHMVNANIMSESELKIHAILSWFQNLPREVHMPLCDLLRYFKQENKLRAVLERAEGRYEGSFKFRTFTDEEFRSYMPRFDGIFQIKHLASCFAARAVRLEHALRTERFLQRGWNESVDGAVCNWVATTRQQILMLYQFAASIRH